MLHLKTVLRLRNKHTGIIKPCSCDLLSATSDLQVPCWNGRSLEWVECPDPFISMSRTSATNVELENFSQIVLKPSSLLSLPPALMLSTDELSSVGLVPSPSDKTSAYNWATDTLVTLKVIRKVSSKNKPFVSGVSLIPYPYRNIILNNGLLLKV